MAVRRLLVLMVAAHLACGGATENLRSDPEATERRGQLELEQAIDAEKKGDNVAAKRHYLAAVQLRPEHFETRERTSLFLRGIGEPKQAVEVVVDFVDRTPGDPRGYHLLADVQFANGDDSAAVETLGELISIDDEDALAYYKRGTVYMNEGKVEAALEDYRKAVDLAPEKAKYQTSLGFALSRLSKEQSLGDAEKVLRRALELDKNDAEANRLLGTVLRKKFDPKAALEYHIRAVELDPDSANAYFELGLTQNALGQNDEAEESLKESLELNPNDPVAWYAFGEVLRITKQYARAVPAYEKALELDPKHAKAANKLGVCHFLTGNLDKAELVLNAAVQVDPEDPYPYFNIGMVYDKAKRYHAAIKAFQRFLELVPSGDGDIPTAKQMIQRLQRKIRSRY